MVHMKVVVMVFAMILMLAGMPASVQAQSETGLVGEWHFDGDAKDSSGNGNDGTIYGASFVEGKFGKALSFDGVNDYVRILNSNSLDITDKISIDTWIEPFDKQPNDYPTVLSKHIGTIPGAQYQIGLGKMESGYKFRFCADNLDKCQIGNKVIEMDKWNHIAVTFDGNNVGFYLNGIIDKEFIMYGPLHSNSANIGISATSYNQWLFSGLIDEVRIYNRALSADEIKSHYEGKQTSLTLTKTASPYSIKQGQTTAVTLTIKNTGTTDIANIEIMDSIHRNFDLISGDFPNPKKFDIIGKGESREIQYMIKAKEGGTFNLDPATGIYVDKDGNIQEAKSELFSVKVIPSFEGDVESPSSSEIVSSAVLLHGEKTDVVLGEDILLKLSAVNLITKPLMTVQVIIYPPSGMSVTGSEFVKSGAGIYTTTYSLNPGDGKDIEIHIKSNQVGDFGVKGRIVYYFGDDKKSVQDHTLTLPIKVRKEIASMQDSAQNPIATTEKKSIPGFGVIIGISGILFSAIFKRRR
jgi:uncharacterized repeat protein (TIGR01451 family)